MDLSGIAIVDFEHETRTMDDHDCFVVQGFSPSEIFYAVTDKVQYVSECVHRNCHQIMRGSLMSVEELAANN